NSSTDFRFSSSMLSFSIIKNYAAKVIALNGKWESRKVGKSGSPKVRKEQIPLLPDFRTS
ncbi:MAG TPA: hypothetical protein VHZ50_03985, partial [Puia sp.]|nr:hypothetical protein [Puia sp.]